MENNQLDQIIAIIKNEGKFEVRKEYESPKIPFDYLIVKIPSEIEETFNYQLILRIQDKEEVSNIAPLENPPDILQIIYDFSKTVEKIHVEETCRLLNLLNKIIPILGFSYDEVEKRCYFKYCVPLSLYEPINQLLVSSLVMIGTILDLYSEMIENVFSGRQKLNEILGTSKSLHTR